MTESEARTCTSQVVISPERELRFLWVQAASVLQGHPSHRPANVNQSLVRIYKRITELEEQLGATP